MKSLSLQLAFNAVDKVSKPMRKMQGSVKAFSKTTQASVMRAQMSISNFNKRSTAMFKKFATGAGIALGAIAGLGVGIFKAAEKTANLGDEIGKTSRQIGISTDYLQEMRYVAERQGVASSAVTESFKYLNKTVGELQMGQGRLLTTLNRTNPALAEQFKNAKTNEEAFNLAVKAIEGMPNQLQKAALAEKIFGTQGREMLKIIEAGSGGITEMQKELHTLGGVMNGDAIKASEQFKDSQERVKRVLDGVKMTLGSELLPIVIQTMDKFVEWYTVNKQLVNDQLQAFITKISNTIQTIVANGDKILFIIKTLGILFGAWAAQIVLTNVALGVMSAYLAVAKFAKFVNVIMLITKAKGAWVAVQWALNAAMAANPIGLIIIAIVAVIAAVVLMIKYWDEIVGWFKKAWDWISSIFDIKWGKLAKSIFSPFAGIIEFIVEKWKMLKETVGKVFSFMWGWVKKIGAFLFNMLVTPLKAILKIAASFGLESAERAIKKLESTQKALNKSAGNDQTITQKVEQDEMADSTVNNVITTDAAYRRSDAQQNTVDVNINNNNNSDVGVSSPTVPIKIQNNSIL